MLCINQGLKLMLQAFFQRLSSKVSKPWVRNTPLGPVSLSQAVQLTMHLSCKVPMSYTTRTNSFSKSRAYKKYRILPLIPGSSSISLHIVSNRIVSTSYRIRQAHIRNLGLGMH